MLREGVWLPDLLPVPQILQAFLCNSEPWTFQRPWAGDGGEAPVPGVSPFHTYQAYFPKAPSLPSCQHSSGKGLLVE